MTLTTGSLAQNFNENEETQKYFEKFICQTSAAMRTSFNNIRGEMGCLAWGMRVQDLSLQRVSAALSSQVLD